MKSSFLVTCTTCAQVLYLAAVEASDVLMVPPEAKQAAQDHAAATSYAHHEVTITATYVVEEVIDPDGVHAMTITDSASGEDTPQ